MEQYFIESKVITLAKTRKRGKKKKQNYSIELIGIGIIFISVLAIGEFGFVGRFFANIIRLFVGETYPVFSLLGIILGIYYIFKGKNPEIRFNRLLGSVLLYSAVLVFLHLKVFEKIIVTDISILSATWSRFLNLFNTSVASESLGGGMIGAFFYSITYFLFANIGTYIFIGIIAFIGVMSIGDFSYNQLFTKLKSIFAKLFGSIKAVFQKTKESIEQNVEIDQKKEKTTRSKKKASDYKPAEQSVEKDEEPIKRGPVPIEVMKQTSLPIGDIHLPEELDVEEKIEDESENGEEISINFVSDNENEDYKLPPLTLLDHHDAPDQSNEYSIIERNIKVLEETFESFGVDVQVVKANLGPAVTKFEIQPAVGVKVSRIVSLADDLALSLAAKDIRIEAPIPGKALIGIEVPNSEITVVHYSEMIKEMQQDTYEHPLEVPLGKDIGGNLAVANLAKMPHLLIAGATGSGKSVGINVIITSLLIRAKPHEVKMMLIDPKMVELNVYEGIPHLLTPVVTKPKKAARALQNVVEEMENRYELFAMSGTRNLDSYNEHIQLMKDSGEENVPPKLPYIVVVVDELADLMVVAAKEVEDSIIRLAQMARAAGIHMILATQRPSVDVITGLIKANVPSRIAFATSSGTDSRTILDSNGAEKLLGRGDMLFLPMGSNQPQRVQGAYVSDHEIQAITDFVRDQQEPNYVEEMIPTDEPKVGNGSGSDELYEDALEIVRELETASISLLQRRLRIGYNRAANIMDDLEANGIVSPQDGSKPRDVLVELISEENALFDNMYEQDE